MLTAMTFVGCKKINNEMETPHIVLETMKVKKKNITLNQSYPAQIEGRQHVKIIPRVEGYLQKVLVKEGQHVKKGQVLFIIDQNTFLAEVKSSEANVALANANIETAQLNYDSRQRLQKKNIVSEHDLRLAAANLSMAKAQGTQAQAQLESARANLAHTILRSPCDGIVGSLPLRVGDFVNSSMQEGLTTVADTKEMYVYFSLSEKEIMSQIAQYGSIDKTVAAYPPVSLLSANGDTCRVNGYIESISGVVEPTTGAVAVRAVFPNTEGTLLSGSTGTIIIQKKMKNVLVIPKSATYEILNKTYAWRIVNKHTESTIITVIPTSDGNHYIVTKGLTDGDVIIAKGASYVKEGQEVQL